ncbi:hypothetical protein Q8F55_006333 [Vanrija albida]|uniref:Uncharacterized protein n=1 Tax=Vanrija albida TaxID=181172 RepID=A0ABR3PX72_9TREE
MVSSDAIDRLLSVHLHPPYSQPSLMGHLLTFEPAATKSELFSTNPKHLDVKHAKGRLFLETLPTIIADAVTKRIPQDQPLTFGLVRDAYLKVAESMRSGDVEYGSQPWHHAVSRLVPGRPIKWPAAKNLEASTSLTRAPGTHTTFESGSEVDSRNSTFSNTEPNTSSEWETGPGGDSSSQDASGTDDDDITTSRHPSPADPNNSAIDANASRGAEASYPTKIGLHSSSASIETPKLYEVPPRRGMRVSFCPYCDNSDHSIDDCGEKARGSKPSKRLALYRPGNPLGTTPVEVDTGLFIGSLATTSRWSPVIAMPATIFLAPHATTPHQVHVVRDLALLTDTTPIEKVLIGGVGSNRVLYSSLKGSIHLFKDDYATRPDQDPEDEIIPDVYYVPDAPCNVFSLQTLGLDKWIVDDSRRLLDTPIGDLLLARFPNGLLAAQIPCISELYPVSPPPQWRRDSSVCIGYRLVTPAGGKPTATDCPKASGSDPAGVSDDPSTSNYKDFNDALQSARDHLPVGDRAELDKVGFVEIATSDYRELYHVGSGLTFKIHEMGGQDVILATAWWGWE